MLFRDTNGNLFNIKRKDFYSESDYYNKIMDIKGYRLLDIIENSDSSESFIFEKMNELMRGAVFSK